MVDFVISEDLVEYPSAIAAMEAQVSAIADGRGRERVWFLEHPPIYTAGTSATPDGLRQPFPSPCQGEGQGGGQNEVLFPMMMSPTPTLPLSPSYTSPTTWGRQEGARGGGAPSPERQSFPVYQTGRGGQYTYHGPGQRVAYVMMNMRRLYPEPDLKRFVYDLEQWVINALQDFDIQGKRGAGRVGVWVMDPKSQRESKIAALGIRVRRWVTFHGIAINVAPDLTHYDGIVPCGIRDYGVTSLAALGVSVSMADLDRALKKQFYNVFDGAGQNFVETRPRSMVS